MKHRSIISCICIIFFSGTVGGFSKQQPAAGQELYNKYCTPCHGEDGTKGKFGAKNLRKSILADDELVRIISDGRRWMPSWKKKLNAGQIAEVAGFIKGLRAK